MDLEYVAFRGQRAQRWRRSAGFWGAWDCPIGRRASARSHTLTAQLCSQAFRSSYLPAAPSLYDVHHEQQEGEDLLRAGVPPVGLPVRHDRRSCQVVT